MKHLASLIPKMRATIAGSVVILATLLLTGVAQAEPLTADKIQALIDTRESLDGFEDNYPGLEKASDELRDMTRPMTSALPALEQFPEAQNRLREVVEEHGFDDIKEWAEVGDRVFLAQIAISVEDMSAEERAMSDEMMSPDYGEDMPEHMRERFQRMATQARQLRAAAESVPQEDIEQVRAFMSQLDPEGY